jgi:uncharacterized membrane protein YdjX (TVP38/TMEM64 family)
MHTARKKVSEDALSVGEDINITAKKKQSVHIWVRLLILFAIVIGLSWLVYITGLWDFFTSRDEITTFLTSLGPFAIVGFIALQIIQVVAAPIPGEVTGIIGGYLFGPVMGVVWSTIGLTIGSYIAFALSRHFGRPFVEKFVNKAIMQRFDYLLHHKGVFLVFMLFLIPGLPKDILCYILGLGHLTTMQFLVIGGIGRLFGTILLTVGGDMIRRHEYHYFFVLVGVTIMVLIVTMIFKNRLENLFRAVHAADQKKKRAGRPLKDRQPERRRDSDS